MASISGVAEVANSSRKMWALRGSTTTPSSPVLAGFSHPRTVILCPGRSRSFSIQSMTASSKANGRNAASWLTRSGAWTNKCRTRLLTSSGLQADNTSSPSVCPASLQTTSAFKTHVDRACWSRQRHLLPRFASPSHKSPEQ